MKFYDESKGRKKNRKIPVILSSVGAKVESIIAGGEKISSEVRTKRDLGRMDKIKKAALNELIVTAEKKL